MPAIEAIPAFRDNYIWALSTAQGCLLVDPGDAEPCLDWLRQRQQTLMAILVTHHHADHTGGIATLRSAWPDIDVYGPATSPFPGITRPMQDGDTPCIAGIGFQVLATPGHTLDHIAWFAADIGGEPALFCGDTLFAGGCGRLFEGSPEHMLHSLDRLSALPDDTRIFCAHEYTLGNLTFAQTVEPDNTALRDRLCRVRQQRQQGHMTLPSRLQEERQTNPFLRSHEPDLWQQAARRLGRSPDNRVEVLAAIRQWKDVF